MPSTTARPLAVLLLPLLAALGAATVRADGDPLREPQALMDLGRALLDAGLELDDADRVRSALLKLREAQELFRRAAEQPYLPDGRRERIERSLDELEDDIEFARRYLDRVASRGEGAQDLPDLPPEGESRPAPPAPEPEVHAPPPREGDSLWDWARRTRDLYRETPGAEARAAIARQMAAQAGLVAAGFLRDLFLEESSAAARTGLHEALAELGTSRVARFMEACATKSREALWRHALDVIYRCLEKPDAEEPERPFQRAVRAFHRLRDRELSLEIITRLDEMGREGTAALGEVIYVRDFGYHDYTIRLLATKRDGRAVPPLVYKMNRFKFEYRVQLPAHEALLQLGWYAVPELIERLDDHAAGIWISWTLRKITGETMGTDKRKWHAWWQQEKVRHPELFEDPAERPPETPSGP